MVFLYNMSPVAARADRPRQPVARALARVAGVPAAALFNFYDTPTVVGGPYDYGIPGAVHAVFKEKQPAAVPAPAGGGGAPPPTDT